MVGMNLISRLWRILTVSRGIFNDECSVLSYVLTVLSRWEQSRDETMRPFSRPTHARDLRVEPGHPKTDFATTFLLSLLQALLSGPKGVV
ncbi:hypothetical protein P280DRAFT_14413 [Massarina eburnea CBS 473.64]|uniref:Uncharacterized protein n=1 Tax=Massarina eburnea CBS 473.64 TaxID=1395130 RepID=A0A6A6SIV3_9PLEO|nr:hypothetical protein P280DRAFT_14413 [Massarina eburnea CBS 473.64]